MNTYQGDMEAIWIPRMYHENDSGSPSGSQTTSSNVLGSETLRTTLAAGLAENAATGGWVTLTTMYEVAEFVAPLSSATVRTTRNVPACPYGCWTTLPLPADPSPKSQT